MLALLLATRLVPGASVPAEVEPPPSARIDRFGSGGGPGVQVPLSEIMAAERRRLGIELEAEDEEILAAVMMVLARG